jgi:hypothetical protein
MLVFSPFIFKLKYEGYSKIKVRLAVKKIRIENKTFLYGTVT